MDKRNILIIEDENSLRLLLTSYLSKHYSVSSHKDGLDALAWMSAGNIPDAVVLDMEMPRLNGAEFLIHIRSSGFFKDIPVIVVSGNTDPTLPKKLKKLGANAFIPKPLNPLGMKDAIEQMITSKNQFATI